MSNATAQRIAAAFTRASRTASLKTPQDYGMEFQNLSFKSTDGIDLAAWLIPAAGAGARRLAVMNHPLNCSKYGFVPEGANAKIVPVHVEFMLTARHLHNNGYDVLFYDQRNHGESASSRDGMSGVGAFEWQDALGAMNYVNGHARLSGLSVALVSHCMGANSSIIAMSKRPEAFDRVGAMVAVQPISMKYMAEKFIAMFGGGATLIDVDGAIRDAAGIGLDDMSPINALRDLKVPVLYLQVREDRMTNPADLEAILAATPTVSEMVWLEGPLHRFDGYNHFGHHPEKMLQFLNDHM